MSSYFTVMFLFGFLPITVLLYQLFPVTKRWIVLLVSSLIFFWSISGVLVGFVLVSGILLHYFGLWLDHIDHEGWSRKEGIKQKKKVLLLAVLVHIGMLAVCKYAGFFAGNLNQVLLWAHIPISVPVFRIGLPIGISFYTMQAVSYCVDVYRQKIKADQNPLRLVLYLVFFPQIMEGPICRYEQTAIALWEGRSVSYASLSLGAQRILWGLFKKLVIADRLNPMVKELFTNYGAYSGEMVAVAMAAYTIQLYMDFSGTMDLVIGTAQIFGITLPENFRQPFFSRSISEFWQRWHITLGTWFKDYVFYPVSMSAMAKKITRKTKKRLGYYYGPLVAGSIALFAVWLCNGLWHGAGWNYIFFGMFHFALILGGNLILPILRKYNLQWNTGKKQILAIIRTTVLVCIGELFFRAEGLKNGLHMFWNMITNFSFQSVSQGALWKLHLDMYDLLVVGGALAVVFIVSVCKEKKMSIRETIASKPLVVRWSLYYVLLFGVILFGAYGIGYTPVDPMYASF